MSRIENTPRELLDLVAAACEGTATDEQMATLEAACKDNDELARLFLDACQIEAELQLAEHSEVAKRLTLEHLDAVLDEADTNQATPKSVFARTRRYFRDSAQRSPSRTGVLVASILMAIGLSVAANVMLPNRVAVQKTPNLPEKSKVVVVESVARLVGDVNALWDGSVENPVTGRDQLIKTGMRLYPGQTLKLESGVAEFKFFNGAEVVLKGPAAFEVEGRKRCRLAYGSLVVRAHEERAKGYIVNTPMESVEDLGTEFGVVVSPNGISSVAVFDGKIRIRPTVDPHPLLPTGGVVFIGGQSVDLDPDRRDATLSDDVIAGFTRVLPALDLVDIGEEPVARAAYDSAEGVLLVRNEPVTHSGRAHSVTFYSTKQDHYVTPLLLSYDDETKAYTITGIGRGIRTNGKGAQVARFRLIAGSDEVREGGHVYGHFDGRLAADRDGEIHVLSTTAGVIAGQFDAGNWLYCWNNGKGTTPALNHIYRRNDNKKDTSIDNLIGTPGRVYSLRLTIEREEEKTSKDGREPTEP